MRGRGEGFEGERGIEVSERMERESLREGEVEGRRSRVGGGGKERERRMRRLKICSNSFSNPVCRLRTGSVHY